MNMRKLGFLAAVAALGLMASPAMADHHGGKKGDHKGKMFEMLDADSNGVVTEAEFVDAHKKRFEEIDADQNGEISKEEAETHYKERKEKMKERWEKRREKGSGDDSE